MPITEKMKSVSSLINGKFKYEADESLDSWHILDLNEDTVFGDCDDYAVTTAYELSDRSVFKMFWGITTRKIAFYRTRTETGKHLVLKYNDMFTDNITAKWLEETPFTIRYSTWLLTPIIKLTIGKFTKQ